MKIRFCLLIICVFLAQQLAFAQEYQFTTQSKKALALYHKASENYRNHDLKSCESNLLKSLSADSSFIEALLLLADVYSDNLDFERAEENYQKVIRINPGFFQHVYFLLGNAQIELKKFKKAKNNLQTYLWLPGLKPELIKKTKRLIKEIDFKAYAYKNPVPFEPINLGDSINTGDDEYINAVSTDLSQLFFTRRSKIKGINDNRKYDEKLMVANRNDSVWNQACNLKEGMEYLGNVGAMTISPDGNYIFFVVCNNAQKNKGCDLYYAPKMGTSWGKAINLGSIINTTAWESQPSFASDGRTLYFASTRPGGLGSSDIWIARIKQNGQWGKPINLGPTVNTDKEEMAPFIHADNQSLYFSSKGHIGMGGSDLFLCKRDSLRRWGKPKNLGYPINTSASEINLIVGADGKNAFISSDKLGGQGRYDIYKFALYDSIKPMPVTYLKGRVFDADTKKPLQARFELIDLTSNKIRVESYSDKTKGEFLVVVPADHDLALNVSKENYLFYSANFSVSETKTELDPYLQDIPLQPIKIGQKVILENIFFNFDAYKLTDHSTTELQKLFQFMTDNPEVKIEVGGHTDNRGSETYNLQLSSNRAKAVYNFLIEQGIDESRLTFNGYGSKQAIASNEDEIGRARNRRTEFRIIE
jgi:outer membrane protein OmpA-like peptidoglycan-associated protein/tetratricopeptide (TPR) repeat protein